MSMIRGLRMPAPAPPASVNSEVVKPHYVGKQLPVTTDSKERLTPASFAAPAEVFEFKMEIPAPAPVVEITIPEIAAPAPTIIVEANVLEATPALPFNLIYVVPETRNTSSQSSSSESTD